MLTSLTIQNYALIEELSVEFTDGLTILTGETGAGKSIIIDALGLLLGERSTPSVVRTGTTKAVVEGTFSVRGNRGVAGILREHGLEPAEVLLIRREISTKSPGRSFLNDSPVPLGVISSIGDFLVDLHGQHEHQSLLRPSTHIEFLDAFGSLNGDRALYQEAFTTLRTLVQRYDTLRDRARGLKEKEDLYKFQLREIDDVHPDPDEEEQLLTEIRILDNAEKVFSTAQELSALLYDGDRSMFDLFSTVNEKLQLLATVDQRFAEGVSETESAKAVVEELARFLRDYVSRMDFSPGRVDEVRERLGRLSLLKKKFGGSVESVLEHRARISEALRSSTNVDEELMRLEGEIDDSRSKSVILAERLSKKRSSIARKIEPEVMHALESLGMPNVSFSVSIKLHEVSEENSKAADPGIVLWNDKKMLLTENGFDQAEFLVSANVGEEPRPLARIASGGEISRIMLALKSVIARHYRVPVVVFDEIDSGVSGRIAQAVGNSLKKLAGTIQVIVITHLPQIAGLADTHFGVYKNDDGNRTTTFLKKLSAEECVEEVARLLSGEKITEAGLKGARELMRKS